MIYMKEYLINGILQKKEYVELVRFEAMHFFIKKERLMRRI